MTGGRARANRRRRRGVGVLVTVVALLAVGAAAAAAAGFDFATGSSSANGADAAAVLPPATAKVTRQTLADSQDEDGELSYGDAVTLTDRIPGTVTELPAAGTVITRGKALYRVDNTPVVLLYGTLPAYRALATGTEGADVEQFERNLYNLGYRGFTVDTKYTAATATAVKQWQDDLGLPKTGAVALGRVVYAAKPVRVDTLKTTVGAALQPGSDVYSFTTTSRVITVDLDLSDQRLATKGAAVTVTLPDNRIVAGKIVDIETVIDDSGSGNGNDTPTTKLEVTITVKDTKSLARFAQATVTVGFTATQRKNVLTVPVAALLALAEGGYGVQVVNGTVTEIVAVQTGLFADGRVEISGGHLSEGATVGMPS